MENETLEKPDNCLEESLDKLADENKKLYQDAITTIDKLSAKGFGNFLSTAYTLFTRFLKTALISFGSMVSSMVVSSISQTVNTVVSLALSVLPGAQIMLQYLAAKALVKFLRPRIRLGKNIINEIRMIISYINALLLDGNLKVDRMDGDLEKAKKHIDKARLLIGREMSKFGQNESLGAFPEVAAPISDEALNSAVVEINKALEYITFGGSAIFADLEQDLNRLTESEGLSTRFNVLGVKTKLKMNHIPKQPFSGKAFTVILTSWVNDVIKEMDESTRFNTNIEEPQNDTLRIISRILDISSFPNILKSLVIISLLRPHIKALTTYLPIQNTKGAQTAIKALNLDKQGGFLSTSITEPYNSALNESMEVRDTSQNYEQGETYYSRLYSIKAQEVAIIMLPNWVKQIQRESGLIAAMLRPAQNKLTEVSEDVKRVIAEPEEDSESIRHGWHIELEKAKVLINGAQTPHFDVTLNGQETTVDPKEINRKFDQANRKWLTLREFIINKTYDFEEQKPKKEPGSIAYKRSQGQLAMYAIGSAFLLNSNVARSAVEGNSVANLQGVRTQFTKQLDLDREELYLAEAFIQEVESVPLFNQVIKPAWDAFNKGIEDLSSDIANKLGAGNLSSLISTADMVTRGVTQTTVVANSIANCLGAEGTKGAQIAQDKQALDIGTATGSALDMEKYQKQVDDDISGLKDRSRTLESLQGQVESKINSGQ